MKTAYISHSDCVKHAMGAGHPEAPERIDAIASALQKATLLAQMQGFDAELVSEALLSATHDPDYVALIFDNAPQRGLLDLDPDTRMNPDSLQAARRAAGAVVQATDLVMTQQASAAFCNVRPPGHHAEYDRAMGFCIFNNIAVGVRHALNHYGLSRVAVVDFDVHHGNGTEDIFRDEPRVLICQTFQAPFYPNTGRKSVVGHIINAPLSQGDGSDAFRHAFNDICLPAIDAFTPELIFISAGFDAHQQDPLAQCTLNEDDYFWVTQQLRALADKHCQGKIVSSLEGGYHLEALGRSAVAHVRALLA